MNYAVINDKFIEYFKSTDVRFRVLNRNSKDIRLNYDSIYTENHHIIPVSLGGSNDTSNIVQVLPEEHVFLHKLRYVVFNTREDMIAVRFCLNGIANNKRYKSSNGFRLTKTVLQGYAFIRQNSAFFRKEHGWQTKEGRLGISEARKGMMPAKDLNGLLIGAVPIDHPNVISGEWVHHSKGVTPTASAKANMCIRSGGLNNTNSYKKTEKEILDNYLKIYLDHGTFYGLHLKWKEFARLNNFPENIGKHSFRFNGEQFIAYFKSYLISKGIPITTSRHLSYRKEASKIGKNNKWVSKEGITKRIKLFELDDYLLNGWTNGRI